jgi:uncharacterized membrane protein YeaQ/YmgE (transglycosylase-associated protein family)
MDDQTRAIAVMAIVGIVAGFLASIVVGGGGFIQYLISGIIGAFVGGFLLSSLGVRLGITNPLLAQIVTATIGAMVVVLLARLIA